MPEHLLRVHEGVDKQQLLSALVPSSARHEVEALRLAGISVDLGDTDDPAYNDPLAIRDTFLMLHEYGIQYSREVGRPRRALERVARIASQAPQQSLRRWGKKRLRTVREQAEQVRSRIMYDRPDVQGQPWHLQNGRATALVTIVDALDLATPSSDGIHEHMSGRLDSSLLTLTFGEYAGWLAGLSLEEAIAESAARFRGLQGEQVAELVRKDLDELRTFVTTKSEPGFKQIVGYCVDSLGIRSRKEEVRKEIYRHAEETGARDLTPVFHDDGRGRVGAA